MLLSQVLYCLLYSLLLFFLISSQLTTKVLSAMASKHRILSVDLSRLSVDLSQNKIKRTFDFHAKKPVHEKMNLPGARGNISKNLQRNPEKQ